jgi:hypothetical protein
VGLQWHVLAMFVPAFHRHLIRPGAWNESLPSAWFLFAAGVVGILDIKFGNFAVSLILLAWLELRLHWRHNHADHHIAPAGGQVQAANDTAFRRSWLASFSSGKVLDSLGWGP